MMQLKVTVWAVMVVLALHPGNGHGPHGLAELPYWTVAMSETWMGQPSSTNRFMATVGLSELSSGLQGSGFRGAADLQWITEPIRPGVQRTITLTALKARFYGVTRWDNTLVATVDQTEKGYELVRVDVSGFEKENVVEVRFEDRQGTPLAVYQVRME